MLIYAKVMSEFFIRTVGVFFINSGSRRRMVTLLANAFRPILRRYNDKTYNIFTQKISVTLG